MKKANLPMTSKTVDKKSLEIEERKVVFFFQKMSRWMESYFAFISLHTLKKPFLLQPLIFNVFKNIEFETLT